MSTRKIVLLLLLLFGEAILIAAFIIFKGQLSNDMLVLNIGISSLVYLILAFNYLFQWVDLNDKSQKQIGSLGISWFVAWLYTLFAIATMIVSNIVMELSFNTQIIIQGSLLFFLLLGIYTSHHSAEKVKEVYFQENAMKNGIKVMRTEMQHLKDKTSEFNLPEPFMQRINILDEKLRFISPSTNNEASKLEYSFVDTLKEIRVALSDYAMNEERIESNLKKLERIYQNRKAII